MTVLPELDDTNTAFWTQGADGHVPIVHCPDCEAWIHPPERICPCCLSRDVAPKRISGDGTIYTYTINHQPWLPGMEVPFAIAVVDLDAAPGVRITARYEGDEPVIGARVKMRFRQEEDVSLPYFVPMEDAA